MLENGIIKKKLKKREKKYQARLSKTCKAGLNCQTHNPLNSRLGLNLEVQHLKN